MSNVSSDYDSSFATESDADNDDFWNEDSSKNNACHANYTTDVEEIIRKNVNVTTANAIELNHHYQAKLRLLRVMVENILSQCQTRLKNVDTMVDNLRQNRKQILPYRARNPGYICGQPFFKDHDLYPGPHNEDYLYRKNVKKEFFPLDMFEVAETHWTAKDKHNTKSGVWVQAVEFLRREGALRAKTCSSSTKAERIRQDIVSLNTLSLECIWSKVLDYEGKYPGLKFDVDWLVISNINIMGRHSAAACEGMWNHYLQPALKKSHWTPEEESVLIKLVHDYNYQDWNSIAHSLKNRSEYQCFVHFRSNFSLQAQIQKKPWTAEEDTLLLRLVQENRIGKNVVWNKVVEKMPYRNKVQVYHRYKYTLTRPIKGAKFTTEEDCVITAYVQQYGDDFKYFPEQLLAGRTMKQVWARYNNTLRYVDKHAGWSLEEDKRLMSYIAEHLTEEGAEKISWSDCSRNLGNHARGSCRSRYYTIEKFLDKNPNATLEDVPRRERKKLSTDVTNENWIKTIMDIKRMPNGDSKLATKNRRRKSFTIPNERGLHDQMIFCFRYQFGYNLSTKYRQKHVTTAAKILIHLLEGSNDTSLSIPSDLLSETDRSITLTIIQAPLGWSSLVGTIRPTINLQDKASSFCRIPPNYNTVLGLRGVCLNAHYESTKYPVQNKAFKNYGSTHDLVCNKAMELFVERFGKIFHWSMMLTMISIDDVKFEDDLKFREDVIAILDYNNKPSDSSESRSNYIRYDEAESNSPVNHLFSQTEKNTDKLQTITGSHIELVKNITIIDPKDLPPAPHTGVHDILRTVNVPGQPIHPNTHVKKNRSGIKHRQKSEKQAITASDECKKQAKSIVKAKKNSNQLKRCPQRKTIVKKQQKGAPKLVENTIISFEDTRDINTREMQDLRKQNFTTSNIYSPHRTELFMVASTSKMLPQMISSGSRTTNSYDVCPILHHLDKPTNLTSSNYQVSCNNLSIDNSKPGFNNCLRRSRSNATFNVQQNTFNQNEVYETLPEKKPDAPNLSVLHEEIVNPSSHEDIISTKLGKGDQNQISLTLKETSKLPNGPIFGRYHGKEVFIIKELDSENKQLSSAEITVTNRCGDEQGNENLIVEECDSEGHDQDYHEMENTTSPEMFIPREVFDYDQRNEQGRRIARPQHDEEGDHIVEGKTFGRFQQIECIEKDRKFFQQPSTTKKDTIRDEKNDIIVEEKTVATSLLMPVAAKVCTDQSISLPIVKSRHCNELLKTVDKSFTAVDIIRLLNERVQTEDSETSVESGMEDGS